MKPDTQGSPILPVYGLPILPSVQRRDVTVAFQGRATACAITPLRGVPTFYSYQLSASFS
jgi:hypothetical protein